MKKGYFLLLICCAVIQCYGQSITPEIYSWKLNTTGLTGYNGISANVQQVQYSTNNVYVSCTDIPSYSIGPWPGNPNTPANQGFVYKITRSPQQNNGTLTQTALGHIGVFVNGVSMFNAKDAMSYNNQNIWHQNAVVVEGPSFDACYGHPAPNSEYHHHQNPICLHTPNGSEHAEILGYAFDGYPVYGPYAYANGDGSGGIAKMTSSYRKRSITTRTTLPDGTVLSPAQYGPAVSTTYPLGYYIEDYEYVSGLGSLDEHNGRICVTPEYPEGTYAYFVTTDSAGASAYPYLIGPTYYGIVQAGNTGPGGGHNTISESVTNYDGLPEIVTLVSPSDNEDGLPVSVTFSWNPSATATKYQLQISPNASFTTTISDDSTITDTSFIHNGLNPSSMYYWHVRAKNSVGWGPYSETYSFSTVLQSVVLLSPADNSVNTSTSPVLVWNTTPLASSYSLQVSDDSLFGTFIVEDSTITDTVYFLSGLDTSTTYYWHVRAATSGGNGPYSQRWQFTTTALPGVSLIINKGWNIISLPINVSSGAVQDIFPTAISQAFEYTFSGYEQADTLIPMTGYWIKFGSLQAININGSAFYQDTITVHAGWNLIGTISDSIDISQIIQSPESIIASQFFMYNNSYSPVTFLLPGRGYWVKVNQDGELIFNGTARIHSR